MLSQPREFWCYQSAIWILFIIFGPDAFNTFYCWSKWMPTLWDPGTTTFVVENVRSEFVHSFGQLFLSPIQKGITLLFSSHLHPPYWESFFSVVLRTIYLCIGCFFCGFSYFVFFFRMESTSWWQCLVRLLVLSVWSRWTCSRTLLNLPRWKRRLPGLQRCCALVCSLCWVIIILS